MKRGGRRTKRRKIKGGGGRGRGRTEWGDDGMEVRLGGARKGGRDRIRGGGRGSGGGGRGREEEEEPEVGEEEGDEAP